MVLYGSLFKTVVMKILYIILVHALEENIEAITKSRSLNIWLKKEQ